MKLRAPAVPLITVDPYFSIWSMSDTLNGDYTRHWTGKEQKFTGVLSIDGKEYLFMGKDDTKIPAKQINVDIEAMSTTYRFLCDTVIITVKFTTPLLLDDLSIASRPVSYLKVSVEPVDGLKHNCAVIITVDDEICLDKKGEYPTIAEEVLFKISEDVKCMRVGSTVQKVLNKSGDDLRINWGYFYLAVSSRAGDVRTFEAIQDNGNSSNKLIATASLGNLKNASALFVFAYDDINSIEYFGKKCHGYWKKGGNKIEDVIKKAYFEYDKLNERTEAVSKKLYNDAVESGGEEYGEILLLAYRQTIAAHKICLDPDGKLLFISKECFSNGCAATVDVTYPSIPLFLLYNPELVLGMLRPIFKYAKTTGWAYDFAPHDVGQYPLLNGQVYGGGKLESQMPVEECGNILITACAAALALKDFSFTKENYEILKKWTEYLIKNGGDPENQLCTDDFAGHLSHNCNLSLKAIMGILSFSAINKNLGNLKYSEELKKIAEVMAKSWEGRAENGDGSFSLTFDKKNTYSLKYNIVWDKIFASSIFDWSKIEKEFESYLEKRMNKYGVPLDNRALYTKSDWLVWAGTLSNTKSGFTSIIKPLWNAYNDSMSRVPMTDWYDTSTAKQIGFQNRTVQGGLFIKILHDKGICKTNI